MGTVHQIAGIRQRLVGGAHPTDSINYKMHIPDGPLSTEVCLATGALSLSAVGYSLHRLKDSLAERTVPLTGMTAALIFAGQMVNFPIGLLGIPSVSGHLIGGVLAAALLGPWAGCVAVTLVLIVQCVMFADGGLLALGANVLNMAVVGSLGGYAVYAAVRRLLGNGSTGTIAGVVVAAWLSVLAAAAVFCLEFFLSWQWSQHQFQFANIFTLMVTFHSAIGVGEALITGGVVSFVLLQRPDLLYDPAPSSSGGRLAGGMGRALTAGVVCALAVAAFLAPFASSYADGLDTVKNEKFAGLEAESRPLMLEDYQLPLPLRGWDESPGWQKVSIALAGLLGTMAVLVIALAFDRVLRLGRKASGHKE